MRSPACARPTIIALVALLSAAGCASRTASEPAPASAPEDPGALRHGKPAPARTHPHPSAPTRTYPHPSAPTLTSLFLDPKLAHAHIAVHVQSLFTGETWLAINERQLLVPASNQKQLTAAAAVRRLGWDFRYTTTVRATGAVSRDGTLEGDLIVVGSGDPTINPRHPLRWAVLDDWAGQIAARGVRVVNGHLIGDDNAFAEPGWGSGWSWDDLSAGYGSPIGALQYHENELEVLVGPGLEPGARAIVSLSPMGSGLLVDNLATTVAADQPSRVGVERAPGTSILTVRGQLAVDSRPRTLTTAVDNPTRLFLHAFREALGRKGIFIGGSALDIDDMPTPPDVSKAETWVTDQSAPLWEIVDVLQKHSRNGYAETLLWTLSPPGAPASEAAGLPVLRETLTELGVDASLYGAFDGSGLSRYNMLSAAALTSLLTTIWKDPVLLGPYRHALPQPGLPGSLERRLVGTPAEGRVWAKTGSMFNVRSLAGYALTADNEPIVFAFLANNFTVPMREIDAVMDEALVRIAGYRGTPGPK